MLDEIICEPVRTIFEWRAATPRARTKGSHEIVFDGHAALTLMRQVNCGDGSPAEHVSLTSDIRMKPLYVSKTLGESSGEEGLLICSLEFPATHSEEAVVTALLDWASRHQVSEFILDGVVMTVGGDIAKFVADWQRMQMP